jgi:hypothetical protein
MLAGYGTPFFIYKENGSGSRNYESFLVIPGDGMNRPGICGYFFNCIDKHAKIITLLLQ